MRKRVLSGAPSWREHMARKRTPARLGRVKRDSNGNSPYADREKRRARRATTPKGGWKRRATGKKPTPRRKYRKNPGGDGGSSTGFTSKIFFSDLIEDVIPGFVGFAATRFLTRAVAVQIEKRKPGWGKHTGAVASIGSFLAAWLVAGRWKAISKWHNPLVVGSGLAALQSLLQLYVPKLGWMVGDPMPELLGMGPAGQLPGPQSRPLPDGLTELEEDPSLYVYDDRYDAGRFSQPQQPPNAAANGGAPPASPTQANPDLSDLEEADLGIFAGSN